MSDTAKALRVPFPPELIGKLPRAATKAAAEKNERGNCQECGKYHVLPAIHLDYVGHAAVTDRLLSVDPEWTWEPFGLDEFGRPAVVSGLGEPGEQIGLWIKLTVGGVTRPGFGAGKSAKEAVSDAIRNAAMRFGVALDLWSKEDLHASVNGSDAPEPEAEAEPRATGPQVNKCHALIDKLGKEGALDGREYAELLVSRYGTSHLSELSKSQASVVIDELETMERDASIPF